MTIIPPRLVISHLTAWSQGTCIVYPSELFDPKAVIDAVIEEKCTAVAGRSTYFLDVLAEVETRQQAGEQLDFSRLRYEHFLSQNRDPNI